MIIRAYNPMTGRVQYRHHDGDQFFDTYYKAYGSTPIEGSSVLSFDGGAVLTFDGAGCGCEGKSVDTIKTELGKILKKPATIRNRVKDMLGNAVVI